MSSTEEGRAKRECHKLAPICAGLWTNYIPVPKLQLSIRGGRTMLSVLINNEISCVSASSRKKKRRHCHCSRLSAGCPMPLYRAGGCSRNALPSPSSGMSFRIRMTLRHSRVSSTQRYWKTLDQSHNNNAHSTAANTAVFYVTCTWKFHSPAATLTN